MDSSRANPDGRCFSHHNKGRATIALPGAASSDWLHLHACRACLLQHCRWRKASSNPKTAENPRTQNGDETTFAQRSLRSIVSCVT